MQKRHWYVWNNSEVTLVILGDPWWHKEFWLVFRPLIGLSKGAHKTEVASGFWALQFILKSYLKAVFEDCGQCLHLKVPWFRRDERLRVIWGVSPLLRPCNSSCCFPQHRLDTKPFLRGSHRPPASSGSVASHCPQNKIPVRYRGALSLCALAFAVFYLDSWNALTLVYVCVCMFVLTCVSEYMHTSWSLQFCSCLCTLHLLFSLPGLALP